MQNQQDLFQAFAEGKIEGLTTKPRMVNTVMSRVFIFEQEGKVLKIYRRDNEWWNTQMQDISGGDSRIDFIRRDFTFDNFLNPDLYLDLRTAALTEGKIVLHEPSQGDDELVIVMSLQDMSTTLTGMLARQILTNDDYRLIGNQFAKIKRALPTKFLPDVKDNWFEQMEVRMRDLTQWVRSVASTSVASHDQALAWMNQYLADHKDAFSLIGAADCTPCIDCNSENLLYANGALSFIDAYPPKESWRLAPFEIDVLRVGADIYVHGGKDAYAAYKEGVREVMDDANLFDHEEFYLLYGALIAAPYFASLAESRPKYKNISQAYEIFIAMRLNTIS